MAEKTRREIDNNVKKACETWRIPYETLRTRLDIDKPIVSVRFSRGLKAFSSSFPDFDQAATALVESSDRRLNNTSPYLPGVSRYKTWMPDDITRATSKLQSQAVAAVSRPHQSSTPSTPHQPSPPLRTRQLSALSSPHQPATPSSPHQSSTPSSPHQSSTPSGQLKRREQELQLSPNRVNSVRKARETSEHISRITQGEQTPQKTPSFNHVSRLPATPSAHAQNLPHFRSPVFEKLRQLDFHLSTVPPTEREIEVGRDVTRRLSEDLFSSFGFASPYQAPPSPLLFTSRSKDLGSQNTSPSSIRKESTRSLPFEAIEGSTHDDTIGGGESQVLHQREKDEDNMRRLSSSLEESASSGNEQHSIPAPFPDVNDPELKVAYESVVGMNWLNDEALRRVLHTCQTDDIWIADVLALDNVTNDFITVKKQVDLSGKKQLLIPLYQYKHWTMSYVDLTTKTIHYYDSLNQRGYKADAEKKLLLFAKNRLSKHGDEWEFQSEICATQDDVTNCGVHALVNALHLLGGFSVPSEVDCKLWRSIFQAIILAPLSEAVKQKFSGSHDEERRFQWISNTTTGDSTSAGQIRGVSRMTNVVSTFTTLYEQAKKVLTFKDDATKSLAQLHLILRLLKSLSHEANMSYHRRNEDYEKSKQHTNETYEMMRKLPLPPEQCQDLIQRAELALKVHADKHNKDIASVSTREVEIVAAMEEAENLRVRLTSDIEELTGMEETFRVEVARLYDLFK